MLLLKRQKSNMNPNDRIRIKHMLIAAEEALTFVEIKMIIDTKRFPFFPQVEFKNNLGLYNLEWMILKLIYFNY